MGYRHVATGLHSDLAIDAHTLIGRPRVPVYKADIGFSGLGTEYLDGEHILLSDGFGHIKLKLPERTSHLLTVGNLLAVEPHISAIADPVEVEQHVLTLLQFWHLKRRPIPPTLLKPRLVDIGVVICRKCFFLNTISSQHSHDG